MKKNRFLIILIVITIIIVAIAAFFLIRTYMKNKADEEVTEAQNLISSGQYQEGLDRVNQILQSNPNSIQANQVKADAAQILQNYDLAKEAYQKLFDLTQNNFYQEKQSYIQYGARPNNLLSGGGALQSPVGEFVITFDSDNSTGTNPMYSYNLWLINGNNKDSVFLDQGSQAYIGDLNLWGNKLYFKTSQGIKVLDLYNNSVSDIAIDGTIGGTPTDYIKADKLIIFNGEIYFIQTVVRTSYTESNTVSKCSLDGHNVTPVVGFQGLTDVGIVTINTYFPMADRVFYRTTNNTIYSLRVQSPAGMAVLLETDNMAENFTANQTDLYISASADGSPVQVFKVGLNDLSIIPLPVMPVNSSFGIGATDTILYYFGPDGLDQFDLATNAPASLGMALEAQTERVNIYLTGDNIIVGQIGNFEGTYKTIINQINRMNTTENSVLFTGNKT